VNTSKILKTFKGHLREKFAGGAVLTKGRRRKKVVLGVTKRLGENGEMIDIGDTSADISHISSNSNSKSSSNPSSSQSQNSKDLSKDLSREFEMDLSGLPTVYVVCGSEDQRVYIWDLQRKTIVQTLLGHRDSVLAVDVHPTLPVIASASLDQDPCVKVSPCSLRKI